MAHCRRGPGGDTVDWITALENWFEKGAAPDKVIVHHLKTEQNYLGLPRLRHPLPEGSYDRTRPVFPYPAITKPSGRGDPAKAENWVKAKG
jgi:feruloyl esterase